MKVRHLNCGTIRPYATPGGLVCHVLLAETADGLVLVDTGFGLHDIATPGPRIGPSRHLLRPALDESETALRQVEALGYRARDVGDIVLTHFDADHAGGLADFPHARVHLTADEAYAVRSPKDLIERGRYLPAQRAHDPVLIEHRPSEQWRGFTTAEILPGILLISLPGHTRGHAAVAVDAGSHWVLHVGDAFYHRGQIDGTGAAVPRALTGMEWMMARSRPQMRANHSRLAALWTAADPDLLLVNAHDPDLLERARG